MSKSPTNGELLRRKHDLRRLYPREPARDEIRARIDRLTPDEVRSEIKRLEAENAKMKSIQDHRVQAESAQMLADREKRAKESAEQLMRQVLGKKN